MSRTKKDEIYSHMMKKRETTGLNENIKEIVQHKLIFILSYPIIHHLTPVSFKLCICFGAGLVLKSLVRKTTGERPGILTCIT